MLGTKSSGRMVSDKIQSTMNAHRPRRIARDIVNRNGPVAVVRDGDAKVATDARVNRADVLRGFEEAIDLARSRSNPAAMLAGWREIAKMCGFYEPECKEVHVNVAVSALLDEIAGMSDAELLVLAAKY
jgi:hypothetical protein